MDYLHKAEVEQQDRIRRHKLLSVDVLKAFEKQGDTSEKKAEDVRVVAKFFHPYFSWTWYATEFNVEEGLFFGFVQGFEGELGYFSLVELNEFKDKGKYPKLLGLPIERDRFFSATLREVMDGVER